MFLDTILGLLTFKQTATHRADERKRYASSLLSKVEASALESSMRLDYEIDRLSAICHTMNVSTELALAGLYLMRDQCGQLRHMVDDIRQTLADKGASEEAITHLDQWSATASVMTAQVSIVAQQLEDAIVANQQPGA